MKPVRKKLSHETPFWVTGAFPECFFITVCCRPRGMNQLAVSSTWNGIRETVETRNDRGIWQCRLLLAMPDHLHALILFEGEKRMLDVMKDWKRWTARTLKIDWQDGFFDHRLRNQNSAMQKRDYILQNPVRAELATIPDDWLFWASW